MTERPEIAAPNAGQRFPGRGRRRGGWLTLLLVVGLLIASCSHLGYYGQALWGGARILGQRRPIDKLIAEGKLGPQRQRQLERALEIRDFASRELRLPDNGSYRSYVELDRRYVVWNVVAAPRFSVEPRRWCFPIAGCVSYRGYFSERRAERFAAKLGERGYDVSLGGVSAYSTLGWFKDPVLSTFLDRGENELAALIFHELAHQRLYLKGDTTFNESFATTVEEEGLRRWLDAVGRAGELTQMRTARRRQRQLSDLVRTYRDRLAAAYAEANDESAKGKLKVELFASLRRDYRELRATWGGDPTYDGWFGEDMNNAHLALLAVYHDSVPAFVELLRRQKGDLEAFYSAADRLARLDMAEREQKIERLKRRSKTRPLPAAGESTGPDPAARETR